MSENDSKSDKVKEFLLSDSTCKYISDFSPNINNYRSINKIAILVKGIFLASVAGVSALVSFSYALSSTRKQNASSMENVSTNLYSSGSQLAFRALKWGTLYAVTGCGLFMFGVWKLANVNDVSIRANLLCAGY